MAKTSFKRQTRFTLDDHLFTVKVRLKDDQPPLLSVMMEALTNAFEFMLNHLKNFYPSGIIQIRNLCLIIFNGYYFIKLFLGGSKASIIINQTSMKSPISSGFFDLQEPDIDNLVESVLNLLNRFINSNAEVSLDESFIIYFRVYSPGHVQHLNLRRRMRIVGCLGKSLLPGTLQVKVGYPGNPQAFANACFLSSIILSHLRNQLNNPNSESSLLRKLTLLLKACDGEKKIFQYGSSKRNSPKQVEICKVTLTNAGDLMLEKLKDLHGKCGVSFTDQIDLYDSLPKVANHLKSQIHVIQGFSGENASLISFPEEFDDSKPQIIIENMIDTHVTAVINLKKFFRHFKKQICFACLKISSISYKHICTKQKMCLTCRQPLKTQTTLNHFDPFFTFCDSQLQGSQVRERETCTTCNAIFLTKLCQRSHESICGKKGQGRAGYYCDTCKNFFKLGFKSASNAKENHICDKNLKRCCYCKEQKTTNHQCLVKDVFNTIKLPKLAFFAFSFKSFENCADCHLIRKNFKDVKNISWKQLYLHEQFLSLVCANHELSSNFETEPNAAVILSEVSQGNFKRTVLFDDNLSLNTLQSRKLETFDYLPKEFSSVSEPFQREKKELGVEFEMIINRLKEKKSKTVLDKFLIEILDKKYRNTTFLSVDANRLHNHLIVKSFSDLNITPFVLQNSGMVNLVSIRSLDMRFLNASAFIEGPLEEWVAQFSLDTDLHYFPDK